MGKGLYPLAVYVNMAMVEPKTKEELEEALELYRRDTNKPDPLSNAERRRTLLFALGREEEAEEIEYKSQCLRPLMAGGD